MYKYIFTVLVFAGISSVSQASDDVLAISSFAARPNILGAPVYPVRAIEMKITGYVDVEVLVAEDGSAREIRSMVSTPKNDDFENAVRTVFKLWTFPVASTDCRPVESVRNVRVQFDWKEDVSVVNVSDRTRQPESTAETGTSKTKTLMNPAAVHAALRYPWRAQKARAEGFVTIKLQVDPKTAIVVGADVVCARSKPDGYENDFIDASKAALSVTYMRQTSDRDQAIMIMVPFTFGPIK